MLKKINHYVKDRKIAAWMKERRIEFPNSQHGFNIHGLAVDEFGYLLRYYTSGRLDSFADFQAIYEAYPALAVRFEEDLASPHEHKALGIGVPTAQANLRNINRIAKAIHDYVEYCHALDREDRIVQGSRYSL